MKHIFPTRQVIHLWAHQSQGDARNAGGNVYFDGPTIYSYSNRFPMGCIHKRKDGARLVLLNSNRYSVTTSKHQNWVADAVRHMRAFDVPYPALGHMAHSKNFDYLVEQMDKAHKKAGRAMLQRIVEWNQSNAARYHKAAADYLIHFGIRRKMPALPSFAAALARVERIENPDPKSLDKRERNAAQRAQAKYATRRLAEIDYELGGELHAQGCVRSDWRLFDTFGCSGARYNSGRNTPMLRVNGEEIETSQGARIPLDHAPRIWQAVEQVRQRGREYVKNGHTLHAGAFEIDRIETDGTLHAGCHVIPHSELRIMARQLALA